MTIVTDIKREFPAEHARLGPSSAERWMACPGSAALVESLPPGEEKDYQHEGNMAHALADYCLRTGNEPLAVPVTYGGQQYSLEMREAVQLFYDTVMNRLAFLRKRCGDLGTASTVCQQTVQLYVEQRVTLAALQPPEEMYGTADAIIVAPDVIDVFDLKYGRGVTVEAHSPQVAYYALATALGFAAIPDDATPTMALKLALDQFKRVLVTIVQPRQGGAVRTETLQDDTPDYDPSTVEYQNTDLRQFAVELLMAASRAHQPDAPLVAGEQCRFCPAKAFCPAVRSMALAVVPQTPSGPPAIETLSLEEAAGYLTKVPVLQAWAKALGERIEQALLRGESVPGFKLVEKRARRFWLDEKEATEVLEGKLGPAAFSAPELLSPAQIEKLTGKKQFPNELVGKKSSGLTMVPESDKRPAVGRLSAPDDFAGVLLPGESDATQE